MRCPHCLENFHGGTTEDWAESDNEFRFGIESAACPACSRHIVLFTRTHRRYTPATETQEAIARGTTEQFWVHPRVPARKPLGAEVPPEYKEEYDEALVLSSASSKASAAMSRRLLQRLLREVVGVTPGDLSREIDEALERNVFPSDVASSIDAIRQVGNFAAHPIKSTSTGELLPVEPGEAEWLLEVVEDVFDVLFTRPGILKKRRSALDAKLAEAGKPPLKMPQEAPKD